MKIVSILCLAVVLIAHSVTPASSEETSDEDRVKIVAITRYLESDPLGKEAKDQRAALMSWLTEAPDVSVKVCSGFVGPLLGSKKRYSTELFSQSLLSAAAFIIENSEQADDDIAVYEAGVEGMLRAYESILKIRPKAKWPFLDDLIEKRANGKLTEHIRELAAECK